MALLAVPSIDQNPLTNLWSEQDTAIYNSLPFYFAQEQYRKGKMWQCYSNMVNERPWQQNMGPIMKSVRKEPSPNLRQFANPKVIGITPLVDYITTRETTTQAQVCWHQFKSPVFNFYQDFTTFFNDHVQYTLNDINDKVMRFRELFYRTQFLYWSRYIYICDDTQGTYLVEAPVGIPLPGTNVTATGTPTKDDAFWINMALRVGNRGASGTGGTLDLINTERVCNILSDDLRIPPFEGTEVSKRDKLADGKYLLSMGASAYRQWTFDPYLRKNRPIQLDIVSQKFHGTPFDDVTVQFDVLPLRFNIKTTNDTPAITWPEPETIEMNPNAPNFQETIPNPLYSRGFPAGTQQDPNVAQFEIGFIAGEVGYRGLKVGMPPGPWSKKYEPEKLRAMNWNGEVLMTDNVLSLDDAGKVIDNNQFKHNLQLISEATFGCLPVEFRSVTPILYRRTKGPFASEPNVTVQGTAVG